MSPETSKRPKTAIVKYSSQKNRLNLMKLKSKLKKNLPDLKIFVSDYDKFPSESSSFQIVDNPGTRFSIKLDKNALSTIDSDKRPAVGINNKLKAQLNKN